MAITTPRELFVHELADAMSAEQQLLKLLPELQRESQHPELKTAFKEHEQETKQHIKNLQAVFKQLGEKPEDTVCLGMKGLVDEHQATHEEDPTPEMLELANLIGAAKSEHYEIVSYTGLVQMAKDLGERDVAGMLQENLDQEKAMAKRVEAFVKDLSKESKQIQAAADDAGNDEREPAGVGGGRKSAKSAS